MKHFAVPIAALAIMFFGLWYGAFLATYLWMWFAVPYGAPPIATLPMMGIMLTVWMLSPNYATALAQMQDKLRGREPNLIDLIVSSSQAAFLDTLIFAMGGAVHWAMLK